MNKPYDTNEYWSKWTPVQQPKQTYGGGLAWLLVLLAIAAMFFGFVIFCRVFLYLIGV